MTGQPLMHELQPRPDGRDREGLVAFLSAARDTSVVIRAGALHRLDLPLLQILLAAAADWRRRDLSLRIEGLSDALRRRLGRLAIPDDALGLHPAAEVPA